MKPLLYWILLLVTVAAAPAADWPEWRGAGRGGEWNESGILKQFPPGGLKFRWRAPVRGGYSGPAVAGRRVFLTDFELKEGRRGTERALCFDELTGKLLWERAWPVDYTALQANYAIGPRATPTVDGDRVFVVGAMGNLLCLDVKSGAVVWQKDFVRDYATSVPVWGMASSPLVDGDRVVCVVGGKPDAKVVAFDKHSGKELWRALSSERSEPGYGQPLLIEAGGTRQLIVWHPDAVSSLDPVSGKVFWQEPFPVRFGLTVATPVLHGNRLFLSAFYNGPMMLELDAKRPAAKVLWRGASNSEINTDSLHCLINTPVFDGKNIYGVCSYGQLRGLDAATGARLWETQELTKEKARWATGFFVRNGDRYFINNDRGELIIARFTPEGYEEISRTKLLNPTSKLGRREFGAVNWSHPAYANGHIFARNDEELVCASLRE
jgi:outer membrane protein assembly factor BamB